MNNLELWVQLRAAQQSDYTLKTLVSQTIDYVEFLETKEDRLNKVEEKLNEIVEKGSEEEKKFLYKYFGEFQNA
jgi:hypothetical protein